MDEQAFMAANNWSPADYASWVANGGTMSAPSNTYTPDQIAAQAQQYNWTPEYTSTQQDVNAIRQLMNTQGAGYLVTGNASLSNGGDATAYLPGLMNTAGITPTQGILNSYQGVTGQTYKPGTSTTYNPTTGKYEITQGQQGGMFQVAPGQFGSGAATANRSPEQLATIKATWQQFLAGQKTPAEIQQAMNQYGVNFADISAATGVSPDILATQLQMRTGGTTGGSPATTNPMPKPQPTQQPTTPPNYGSPYNPGLITPNPNGTPTGSTHPASGMVGGNTSGSYADRMNQYYNSYFKDAPGIDQGMLSDWYSTSYNPAPTGFSTGNKGASSAQGLVNSLNWGRPDWDAESTPKLFNYMSMYGLKPADVANALGFTEQQIIDHFKKYNIDVTKLGTSADKPNPTTDPLLDRPTDGG